jgi:hypothetical protein
MKPYGVTGEVLDIKGRQTVLFTLNGHEFEHSFLVCPLPTTAAGLLGTDFKEKAGAVIDFERSKMSLGDIPRVSASRDMSHAGSTALTVFSAGKEGHSLRPSRLKAKCIVEQRPASPRQETPATQCNTWLVRATENIIVAPRSRQIVVGRLESQDEHEFPPLVCVEPAVIPIEGILLARALSRVESMAREPSQDRRRTFAV